MGWVILYILGAAAATFGLCVLAIRVLDPDCVEDTFFPAVLCGLVWPIAAPIYAAVLAAVWLTRK